MLIVPFASSLEFLDAIIAGILENSVLCLFKNNYVPLHTTILANLTEADFDGYSRITLTSWPAATLDGNNKASSALGFQTFTKTGNVTANDIYGVFVLDAFTNLIYAERFATAPFTLSVTGQLLLYKPVFTATSEF